VATKPCNNMLCLYKQTCNIQMAVDGRNCITATGETGQGYKGRKLFSILKVEGGVLPKARTLTSVSSDATFRRWERLPLSTLITDLYVSCGMA
jgi:hypothetical protein